MRDLERICSSDAVLNTTVYDRYSSPYPSLSDSCAGPVGSSTVPANPSNSCSRGQPWGVEGSQGQQERGLLGFESRFESGNLCRAVHVWENEYDLFLSQDVNDR